MSAEGALIQLCIGPGINEDVSEKYNEAVNVGIEAIEHIEKIKAIIENNHLYSDIKYSLICEVIKSGIYF